MTNAQVVSTAVRRGADARIFGRVIVGVDRREPGFEALRQGARLVADDGWLEVFTAVYLAEATLAGWSSTRMAAELEDEARDAIRKAEEIAGPRAESRLVNGRPLDALLGELRAKNATLAVVGTHGHSRFSEIVIGGVVGELLHVAPCSVLVARAQLGGDVELVDGDPVSVLVAASRDADILVVGSRGLHGVRALGSVSERI